MSGSIDYSSNVEIRNLGSKDLSAWLHVPAVNLPSSCAIRHSGSKDFSCKTKILRPRSEDWSRYAQIEFSCWGANTGGAYKFRILNGNYYRQGTIYDTFSVIGSSLSIWGLSQDLSLSIGRISHNLSMNGDPSELFGLTRLNFLVVLVCHVGCRQTSSGLIIPVQRRSGMRVWRIYLHQLSSICHGRISLQMLW